MKQTIGESSARLNWATLSCDSSSPLSRVQCRNDTFTCTRKKHNLTIANLFLPIRHSTQKKFICQRNYFANHFNLRLVNVHLRTFHQIPSVHRFRDFDCICVTTTRARESIIRFCWGTVSREKCFRCFFFRFLRFVCSRNASQS